MTVYAAKALAELAHKDQFRRDGVTPYIVHPQEVASRVKGDNSAEMVAWLHDVVEDTLFSLEYLREYGIQDDVITAVDLLTHKDREPYMEYIGRIKGNALATKVKIADMEANLSDSPTKRQIEKYERGLEYLRRERNAFVKAL
tara:strand:+ start:1219 stop:1647 length:429 start_codon:yes stop_codon:yes gene_type:complete